MALLTALSVRINRLNNVASFDKIREKSQNLRLLKLNSSKSFHTVMYVRTVVVVENIKHIKSSLKRIF